MIKTKPAGFVAILIASGILFAGCEAPEDGTTWNTESNDTAEDTSSTSTNSDGSFDLSNVRWLHTNVSGWSQTATLSVSFSGDNINLNYNKARAWPSRNTAGASVNANAWVFVNINGTWYAATWEWLRYGQTSKAKSSVSGSHIGTSPLNNFSPQSGTVYGFMVSGLARSDVRNVQERSNVCMARWP